MREVNANLYLHSMKEAIKGLLGEKILDLDSDPLQWDWRSDSCPCGLPAGDCTIHPRARTAQKPPAGNWRTWAYIAGRGAGKTRSGAEWIQHRVESGVMRLGCLISATANDIRDVVTDGPSGLLNIAPPWCQPRFEPSKRRVVWPNGARAICLSGEEPERARGLNIDTLWADEVGCWSKPAETWRMAQLALRAGPNPQAMITTTPRRVKILEEILKLPTTVETHSTTYENKQHLSPEFIEQIKATFEGTRLGRQELHGEFLLVSDAAWFSRFDPAKHVSESADYYHHLAVHIAIDCGVSQTVGGVFFQVQQLDQYRHKVTVYDEYLQKGFYSAENALAIKTKCEQGKSGGYYTDVVLDPAATAGSGHGPAAQGEFHKVFPNLTLCPRHSVCDALDQMECLLDTGCLVIHPRCVHLIEAMQNYSRKVKGEEFLDEPAEGQSPHEDLVDSLRYGIRNRFPEGRAVPPNFQRKSRSELFG